MIMHPYLVPLFYLLHILTFLKNACKLASLTSQNDYMVKICVLLWISLACAPDLCTAQTPGAARMDQYLHLLEGKRVAVFANQTSLIGGTHLVDTLLQKGLSVVRIFSPEHGFRGDADAGETVTGGRDS